MLRLVFVLLVLLFQHPTYFSSDGLLSFEYPAGWEVIDFEGIVLVTNIPPEENFLETQPDPGSVFGFIFRPGDTISGEMEGTPESLDEAFDLLMPGVCESIECSPRQFFNRSGTPAVRVDLLLSEGGVDLDVAAYVFEIGREIYFGAIFFTPAGEMEQATADISIVVNSLKLKPPQSAFVSRNTEFETLEFSQEFSSDTLDLRFSYPDGWALHFVSAIPYLANSETLADSSFSTALTEDDVRIGLVTPSIMDVYFGVDATLPPAEVLKAYLEANLAQNPVTTETTIEGRPAAFFARPVNAATVNAFNYYAVQLENGQTMIFMVMTAPGKEAHFAGVIPYLLDTVQVD